MGLLSSHSSLHNIMSILDKVEYDLEWQEYCFTLGYHLLHISTSPVSSQNQNNGPPGVPLIGTLCGNLSRFLSIVMLKSPATMTGTPGLSAINPIRSHKISILNGGECKHWLTHIPYLQSYKKGKHTFHSRLFYSAHRRKPPQNLSIYSLLLNKRCGSSDIVP